MRRIAIRKVDDVALLEQIAESDPDPALRELAAERVREVLVSIVTSDGPLAECDAALARLNDTRSLVATATAGAHESVRRAALARASGDRVLRDIVRTASDPAIRSAALDRIQDAAVLRSIIVGDCPPELALQALARIDDVTSLQTIVGSRTAAKSVRQRARALLASRSGDRPVVGVKEARARQLELCTRVHMLRALPDTMRAAEEVREAQREWQQLAREVEPRSEVAEPFMTACEAILAEAASLARRRAESDHARIALAESITARAALCERVEALDGAEALRDLAAARAAWNRLLAVSDERGTALAHRFTLACENCAARHQEWLAGATLRAQLELIVGEAEALVDASPLASAKQWRALERRWGSVPRTGKAGGEVDLLARRFAAAGERLQRRWQEGERRRSDLERENLTRLEALCSRLQEMAEVQALKPSAGRRSLLAADAALSDLGPLPPSERRAVWIERLSAARDQLLRRVSQEEQTEEWRRWANVGAQEEIIRRVEALIESSDLAEGTRQLGRLQEEWARVATASPERAQALWERFRTARNELRRRCDTYLADNLEQKRLLCAQVASLGDSASWNETAELIKRLQAEWTQIGPVPADGAAALWHQFREPCDRFFARRKAHFERRDEERRESARKQTTLCERAEVLAESTDWDTTASAVKQLQGEWKESGPAPREQADALWRRFKTACDRFFERRGRREELAREEAVRKAHAICGELEALATSLRSEDGPAADRIRPQIDAVWSEWLRLDLALVDATQALTERLCVACEQIVSLRPESLRGTRLDPDATRKRREKLCARLEALLPATSAPPRQTSLQEMALALRERLAANTIAGGARGETGRQQDVGREVERICASWAHLGPPLDDDARALAERFERARGRWPARRA